MTSSHTGSDSIGDPLCTRCKGRGFMPSPGGVEGEYCPCGRCGGVGIEPHKSDEEQSRG